MEAVEQLPMIAEVRASGEVTVAEVNAFYASLVERLRPELDRLLETEQWRWLVEP